MSAIRKLMAIGLATVVIGWFASVSSVWACPGCKEAVAAQDIESDSDVYNPSQLARAYNYSIYLMLSMPYLLTVFFGAACYIMLRRQAMNGDAAGTATGLQPSASGEQAGETDAVSDEVSSQP